MSLPTEGYQQLTPELRICRLLNGLWQVSGAHGRIDPHVAIPEMFAYVEAGFTTWDLADHYGPAEDFIGEFRRQLIAARGETAWSGIQALTKWVPRPGRMTRQVVENAINVSLRRMAVPALDLLQFHWWEYEDPGYLDALNHLADLQREGKIRALALTNFDTEHLQIITEHGIRVVSNQVQFSLVDRRPEVAMIPFCQNHNIKLLTYGTVCGGLLAEKYLGQPEPHGRALNTVSLEKYKMMIDSWGGWKLFQELLTTLKQIADKYHVSIANVGVRYILDRPAVGGVIIGTRLGIAEHRTENARTFSFSLDADDRAALEHVLCRSRDLYTVIGDCGDEYRR